MKEQSITVKIAQRSYTLKASSPEHESLMRYAADSVNKLLDSYNERFPGTSLEDKMVFVALNESMAKFAAQRAAFSYRSEQEQLEKDISEYLLSQTKSR